MEPVTINSNTDLVSTNTDMEPVTIKPVTINSNTDVVSTNTDMDSVTMDPVTINSNTEKRTNIEHFAVDEQIDILFITETWLRCQGDEAKSVDMMPPGDSMKSFPHSTRGGGVGLHCERHFLSCYRCCVFLVQSLVF